MGTRQQVKQPGFCDYGNSPILGATTARQCRHVQKNVLSVSAAQQLNEADHTIEAAFELCLVFGAYQFAHRSTASAVWRLISQPLGGATPSNIEGDWASMTVTLVQKYNPEWPTWFASIRQVLEASLGDVYLRIEHVGSTSVPGMTAKPIIDIDVVIANGRFEEIKRELAQLGYIHEGDLCITGREAFDLRNDNLKSKLPPHHLYVCVEDSLELKRHIAFRDYLRGNQRYAEQLSQMKWSLAAEHENDKQAYMEGKSVLVREIIELALKSF